MHETAILIFISAHFSGAATEDGGRLGNLVELYIEVLRSYRSQTTSTLHYALVTSLIAPITSTAHCSWLDEKWGRCYVLGAFLFEVR